MTYFTLKQHVSLNNDHLTDRMKTNLKKPESKMPCVSSVKTSYHSRSHCDGIYFSFVYSNTTGVSLRDSHLSIDFGFHGHCNQYITILGVGDKLYISHMEGSVDSPAPGTEIQEVIHSRRNFLRRNTNLQYIKIHGCLISSQRNSTFAKNGRLLVSRYFSNSILYWQNLRV